MENNLPVDIKEARDNFKKSEKSPDLSNKIRFFERGIDIINNYLEEEINSADKDYIDKIKLAYSRAFLKDLPKQVDDIMFLKCLFLFITIKKEIDIIIKADPLLRKIYYKFLEPFKEVVKIFEIDIPMG